MEDVREYLHLYLGCDCLVDMTRYLGKSTGKNFNLNAVPMRFESINRNSDIDQCWGMSMKNSDGLLYFNIFDERCRLFEHFVHSTNLKPILRRLDSMTEEEIKKIDLTDRGLMLANFEMGNELNFTAKQFVWLLSKGFWLFGDKAFDKGLIIDSKTLNKEV